MLVRVASLNLCWQATAEHRRRQREVLSSGDFDLALLQEARRVDLPALLDGGTFDWCVHSLAEATHPKVLGVAVLGRGGTVPAARHQLGAEEFVNEHVYAELGRWFHERHVAVDVRLPDGSALRVLSAQATPGTSKGPGSPGRGVGRLKPWFHARIAQWIATWHAPFLFAIDANTPGDESLDINATRFHIPAKEPGGPGEDLLLGPPHRAIHQATDLWRTWLESPAGLDDKVAIPPEGPLARSHSTGGRWYRYDHLWGTAGVTPVAMAYSWDETVSDHSLVTATLSITAPASLEPAEASVATVPAMAETTIEPRYGKRYARALRFAARLHATQARKGTEIPYISHLLHVSALVWEDGGDEDLAIAALLHDAVEDQGGAPTLERIHKKFGERVARIVEECSDSEVVPKPPWRDRKIAYLESLAGHSDDAKRVVLADKLHNATSMLDDVQDLEAGELIAYWERLNATMEGSIWYLHNLHGVLAGSGDYARGAAPIRSALLGRLDRVIDCLAGRLGCRRDTAEPIGRESGAAPAS